MKPDAVANPASTVRSLLCATDNGAGLCRRYELPAATVVQYSLLPVVRMAQVVTTQDAMGE